MIASMSLPVGESSACSVTEVTRTPRRRSIDLKATAYSRLRVKRENFQTRISRKGASARAGGGEHPAELRTVGDPPALRLVDVFAAAAVAVALGGVAQRSELGGNGEVDILAGAGDAGVKGHRRRVGSFAHRFLCIYMLTSA